MAISQKVIYKNKYISFHNKIVFAVKLTILTRISRSHDKTQNLQENLTS